MKYQVAAAYNNRARLYLLDKDCQAAATVFLSGLKIVKKESVKYGLLTNLGRAKLCQSEYQEAQNYLQEAIALDGDRPEAYCILAPVIDRLEDKSGTSAALAKCPVNSLSLPELDNWLKAKGLQQVQEN